MNFLAHLFLSYSNEPVLVGNFLTDFLNKKEATALPEHFQAGVQLHRLIDSFTDQHPGVQEAVRALQPFHRKYAPVVIDVFYDYFLIQHWSEFTEEPFPAFRQRVYRVLETYLEDIPARLQPQVQRMIDGDWLQSYGATPGILYAIEQLSRRASRPEWLLNAADSLTTEKAKINTSFLTFFPDVVHQAQRFVESS